MKIEFDGEANALYIEFRDGEVYDCVAVSSGVNVDIDEDGTPLGIEILDVSQKLSIEELCNLTIQNFPFQFSSPPQGIQRKSKA